MTLIKSISGIRGTIGGKPGENLTPLDLVRFVSAYVLWLKQNRVNQTLHVVVGRDARVSGPMVQSMVLGTLVSMGVEVVNLELATTPTVEIAVQEEQADGGIIITASHNPGEWNALKLLNYKGEFLSASEGLKVIKLADLDTIQYNVSASLGRVHQTDAYNKIHINKVLEYPLVDSKAIKKADFKVAVDCVNSVGAVVLPELLQRLGVENIITRNCVPDGLFTRNPEPIPANLKETLEWMGKNRIDVGFIVDPDVDRLVIVNEDGSFFGEEYTLVAVADYVLSQRPGNTVSNLSSTRALKDITENYGAKRTASAVGEVNVVEEMKRVHAVIGGEGNGGVIVPDLHYGRDALIGIALFLTHLSKSGLKCSELKSKYPEYHIVKRKFELKETFNLERAIKQLKKVYSSHHTSQIDGLFIDLGNKWIHIRKSNTEPIIRVIGEAPKENEAEELVDDLINRIKTF